MAVRVIGLSKAIRAIEGVEKALQDVRLRPVLLEAAGFIADEAQKNAPQGLSGTLKASLKASETKQRRGMVTVFAAIDRKVTRFVNGKKYRAGAYAHLVEGGTKPHIIKPRAVGFFANRRGSGKLSFNGRVVSQVSHPGTTGTKFWSNAIKSQRSRVNRHILAGIKMLLEKGWIDGEALGAMDSAGRAPRGPINTGSRGGKFYYTPWGTKVYI